MFQDGLFSFVTADSSIRAILGTGSRGDKETGMFYMLAVPQATLPYLVYQRVYGQPASSYDGANQFQNSRWRVKCVGTSQRKAVLLAEAVKLLFKTWVGTFPDGTVVQHVALETEADDAESLPHGTLFSVHLDFSFKYIGT